MSQDLAELRQRVALDRLVRDAEVISGPGPAAVTVLIVPQGYSPGPLIRQRVMRLADGTGGPLQVAIMREIPRDEEGMVDQHKALAAMRLPGALHRFEPAVTDTERALTELICQLLPDAQVSMTDTLVSLGADSLVTVELLELISQRMGVELDQRQLLTGTVRDVSQHLDRDARA
jgi:acyl carrier protein